MNNSSVDQALGRRVYIHRAPDGRMYIGRGSPDRAASHASRSHNPDISRIIQTPGSTLEFVDLPSSEAAEIVEGLLIDVLGRVDGVHLVNGRGDHWRFQPLGVPEDLEHRTCQPALYLAELGKQLGGALLVLQGTADFDDPGRARADASGSDAATVVKNAVRHWDLGDWRELWATNPASSPNVLVPVQGPVKRRLIRACVPIDHHGWRSLPSDEVPVAHTGAWTQQDIDHGAVRGRLVADAKFSRRRRDMVIWVDAEGTIHRH